MEQGILEDYELLEEQGLPGWMTVYFDYQKVQASNRTDLIEQDFERGIISRSRLVDSVNNHTKDHEYWATAARAFYYRFGRDYFREEYDVTAPESEIESLQWHMTTLAQELILHYNEDVVPHFDWQDDGTALIQVEEQE